jgi:hypothetical protein
MSPADDQNSPSDSKIDSARNVQSEYQRSATSVRKRETSSMLVLSLMGVAVGLAGGLVSEGLLLVINFISNIWPDAKAATLAHKDFPVIYTDEVLHHVAGRLLDGG